MPIITFVVGYVYLVFGSLKTFDSLGFDYITSCFSTAIITITMGLHVRRIARTLKNNLVCPRTFALQMLLTHFSMVITITGIVSLGWIPTTLMSKISSVLLFLLFGYLLNIGAGTFPTFSVADPFYWNQNREVSSSHDRAFKSLILALLSYCFANSSNFWHSVATGSFILIDVVLMAHYWEIAGFEDFEEEMEEPNLINIPEDPAIEDLHMD